jgi:SAM-dependent methyltransferase
MSIRFFRKKRGSIGLVEANESMYGFPIDSKTMENKPWISWLMMPSVLLITAYVWLKKKWWIKWYKRLPPVNSMFYDGGSDIIKVVTKGHGNWESLSTIYNPPYSKLLSLSWILEKVAFSNANCQAVRNRLRITRQVINDYVNANSCKQILCIACGSAESTLPFFLNNKGKKHKLTLVDSDHGVVDFLNSINGNIDNSSITVIHSDALDYLKKDENRQRFDVIELIGATEYVDDVTASSFIRESVKALKPGGYFITSNLRRNIESGFVKVVIDWPMVYRTRSDLCRLIESSGVDEYEIIQDPLSYHNIVISKK